MRRSVEKGEEEEEEEGGRREKGPPPPVSSIFTRVLPGARSESRRRRRKSGRGADWWLPEGLLILWKSAPPRHIWNLPTLVSRKKGGHTSSKFRLSTSAWLHASLFRFISERGEGRREGCCRLKIFSRTRLSGFSTFPGWDSEWFRLNDPSSTRGEGRLDYEDSSW